MNHSSLAGIKLIISDVDGVMTDGKLYYDYNGECMKVYNVHDGHGIKMLLANGIQFGIITGSRFKHIRSRMVDLGVSMDNVICESVDKGKDAGLMMHKMNVRPHETACIGDDMMDIPMFRACGFAFAPANAVTKVAECATVLTKRGGEGAIRELADHILRAKYTAATTKTSNPDYWL